MSSVERIEHLLPLLVRNSRSARQPLSGPSESGPPSEVCRLGVHGVEKVALEGHAVLGRRGAKFVEVVRRHVADKDVRHALCYQKRLHLCKQAQVLKRNLISRRPMLATCGGCLVGPDRTDSCTAPHFQYHVSGRLAIHMDDGTEFIAGPGDVTSLPSGHDAWVVGDEPVVTVDWFGASNYAR